MKRSVLLFFILLLSCLGYSQNKLKKGIEWNDSLKIKKYLSKGVDADVLIPVVNDEGKTKLLNPLSYAHNYKKPEALAFLLDHLELFKNAEHYVNEVFIHSLARLEEDSLSEVLYKRGVNINDSCALCRNNNAIMVAATAGNEKWYFKLKPDSDLHYVNENNSNLVHAAATSPSKAIIEDILKIKGLDPNAIDDFGSTPLDYAIWNYEFSESFDMITGGGGDFKKARNMAVQYGYHPNPDVGQFGYGIVKKNRKKIFYQDADGLNILDFIAYPFDDKINSDQNSLIYNILQEMINQLDSTDAIPYTNTFLSDKDITYYVTFFSYYENEEPDEYMHLFRTYVEFVGLSVKKGFNSPFTKRDFKFASKRFGKEQIIEWFQKYGVPLPE